MLKLIDIYVYPIKSLGGIRLSEAVAQKRGLQYDRRWMLVDDKGVFMSQRKYSKMALLKTSFIDEELQVTAPDSSTITIFLNNSSDQIVSVKVWDSDCKGYEVGDRYNDWFSNQLDASCRLIYMGDQERQVDSTSIRKNEIVSYADGYPYLIVGQASLDDLNNRLEKGVPMNRFRPNLVFSGGRQYEEDNWNDFQIGSVKFDGVKPCSRCIMTTIDQRTGTKGKEPLKSLSLYRKKGNKIFFGLNACVKEGGVIRVGDSLTSISDK